MNADTPLAANSTVDLSNCDREPIHIPGAIQPHGLLLVLREPDLGIVQVSENTGALIGAAPDTLLGAPLAALIGAEGAAVLRQLLAEDLRGVNPLRIVTFPAADPLPWDGIVHRTEAGVILELEPATGAGPRASSVFFRVRESLARFQDAQTLAALCDTVANEVRALTGLDRVDVYRFDAEWNGEVIAEARSPEVDAFLGLHFPATDIPTQARELYRRNPLRLIADVGYEPAHILPEPNPVTDRPLDLSQAVLRSVSPIHLEYLRNMGVGASMSISLLRGGELWGLIACHHHAPHYVPYEVRVACEMLGQAFAAQMGVVASLEHQERTLEIAAAGATLLDRMARSEDWVRSLSDAPDELLGFVGATGAAIRRGGEWVRVGDTPSPAALTELAGWLAATHNDVYHTDRLPHEFAPPAHFAGVGSGLLAVALRRSAGEYLLWFRPEVPRTVEWAGNPEKAVHAEQGDMQLHPRKSFAAWQQTVRGRSAAWQPSEVSAAAELRGRIIDIVVRQADQLEQLNAELRRSNDELDAFTYIASHDLKEPLRGIHNFSVMLLEEQHDVLNDEGTAKLETLVRLTQRMDAMLDSLLTFSRVGKLDLPRDPVPLQEVLDNVLDTLATRIAAAGVEIRVPQPLPTVRCDVVRAAAILQNLIVNAIKYNDKPDPLVEIGWREAEPTGAPVVLYVRDNGIGIAERHWETVFRIFRRLHPRDRYGGGTGAGLAIVKRMVERHGGQIWIDSVPGEGTTFFFKLSATIDAGNSDDS